MGRYSERIFIDPREHDKVCDVLEKVLERSGKEKDMKKIFLKSEYLLTALELLK